MSCTKETNKYSYCQYSAIQRQCQKHPFTLLVPCQWYIHLH